MNETVYSNTVHQTAQDSECWKREINKVSPGLSQCTAWREFSGHRAGMGTQAEGGGLHSTWVWGSHRDWSLQCRVLEKAVETCHHACR